MTHLLSDLGAAQGCLVNPRVLLNRSPTGKLLSFRLFLILLGSLKARRLRILATFIGIFVTGRVGFLARVAQLPAALDSGASAFTGAGAQVPFCALEARKTLNFGQILNCSS